MLFKIQKIILGNEEEVDMKKRFLSLVAVAMLMLFLSVGSVFAAQNTGFYIGVVGGYVMPQEMTMSDPSYYGPDTDAELDDGFLVGFKTGWNTPFTRGIMALEMEYNYISGTDFDNSKLVDVFGEGLGTLNGDIDIHAVLFNIKARYPQGRVHPYIGMGIGYAYFVMGDIIAREYGGSGTMFIPDSSGGGFCYQFMAGLELDITPNLSLGIGYKYFGAEPDIDEDNYWDDDSYWSPNYDLDYKASIITMGLTFTY